MSGSTQGSQPGGDPYDYPAGLGPPPQGDPSLRQPPPQAYPPGPAGYPPAPGYYPSPSPTQGVDGFAVASLIFGVIGWILLSVVFGFVALGRIKRSGRRGRGLAISGLVLSGIWAVAIALFIVFAIATGAGRSPSGEVVAAGSESAGDLQVGDCLTDPPAGTETRQITAGTSFSVVPCNQPHKGEVYAVFDLPAGPYPGEAEVDRQVDASCADRLSSYSPSAATDPAVLPSYIYPLASSWNAGDREVICIAGADPPVTGSIRGR